MCENICAIIVTYNPNINKISECIASLVEQVSKVIVVDNGSTNAEMLLDLKSSKIDFIFLHENKGIAFAQNHGAEIALNIYSTQNLFFSDQDTIFPVNTLKELYARLEKYNKHPHKKVGCVSPFFKDHRTGHLHPSVFLNLFTTDKMISQGSPEDLFPSHVIASGMLISRDAWLVVGSFREDLFIDWVDTEWCWRAQSKGYKTLQTSSVIISHELGYGQKKFAGRFVTIHNSFRNYYKIRNAIFLMLYSSYSFKYRYHLFFHSAKNIIFELLYSKNRMASTGVVWRAIMDAVLRNMNKGN